MRKLSQATLELANIIEKPKFANRAEHFEDNMKNTLYRVVIRDEKYWNSVTQTPGGFDKFRPTGLFFDNKVVAGKLKFNRREGDSSV